MPQLEYTKMSPADWGVKNDVRGYPDAPGSKHNDSFIDIGDGHQLHYQEFGNPKGEPVIFLHGGPGGDTSENYSKFFDPAYYHIIIYDQRGSGKSVPHVRDDLTAALHNNDTQHLIADIEALRTHLGIEKAHIFGGSWGSTLALAYAQAHPEVPKSLVLRGIFSCGRDDLDYFYQGNAAEYDPAAPDVHYEKEGAYRAYLGDGTLEGTIPLSLRDPRMKEGYSQAWKNYVEVIPKAERGDMVAAYHRILNDPNTPTAKKLKAAKAWSVWEGITSNLCHDVSPEGVARFADDRFATAFATIENHYFFHGAFLDGQNRNHNALLDPENIGKIKNIPTYIVHGTHDQVCPVRRARHLREALRDAGATEVTYVETDAGHSMFEKPTAATLTGFMDTIRDRAQGVAPVTAVAVGAGITNEALDTGQGAQKG